MDGRIPKVCDCPKVRHRHGTYACYIRHACRCLPCCYANSEYEIDRKRRRAEGRVAYVSGDRAREHVRGLAARGMGRARVAEVSGVGKRSLDALMAPGSTRRVRPDTEAAILAVRWSPAPKARISGVGTRRRLQALVAVGWTQRRLARELGRSFRNMHRIMFTDMGVTMAFAGQVRELYDRAWSGPPSGMSLRERQASTRARRNAQDRGWAPPMAWDDDTIDDPEAIPLGMVQEDDRKEYLVDASDTRNRLRGLMAAGWTPRRLARELGRSQRNVHRVAMDAGGDQVTAVFADEVLDLYRRVGGSPPEWEASQEAANRDGRVSGDG